MRYLFVILLIPGMVLLIPNVAMASEYAPEFCWDGPIAFVSGAPLDPLTDLSEYRLYCPSGPTVPTQTLPNEDNCFQAPTGMFPPGDYTCHMTAVGLNGEESDPSNDKTFTVVADRPGPIVIFEVN